MAWVSLSLSVYLDHNYTHHNAITQTPMVGLISDELSNDLIKGQSMQVEDATFQIVHQLGKSTLKYGTFGKAL